MRNAVEDLNLFLLAQPDQSTWGNENINSKSGLKNIVDHFRILDRANKGFPFTLTAADLGKVGRKFSGIVLVGRVFHSLRLGDGMIKNRVRNAYPLNQLPLAELG